MAEIFYDSDTEWKRCDAIGLKTTMLVSRIDEIFKKEVIGGLNDKYLRVTFTQ